MNWACRCTMYAYACVNTVWVWSFLLNETNQFFGATAWVYTSHVIRCIYFAQVQWQYFLCLNELLHVHIQSRRRPSPKFWFQYFCSTEIKSCGCVRKCVRLPITRRKKTITFSLFPVDVITTACFVYFVVHVFCFVNIKWMRSRPICAWKLYPK